jgi:hypothetical protein
LILFASLRSLKLTSSSESSSVVGSANVDGFGKEEEEEEEEEEEARGADGEEDFTSFVCK